MLVRAHFGGSGHRRDRLSRRRRPALSGVRSFCAQPLPKDRVERDSWARPIGPVPPSLPTAPWPPAPTRRHRDGLRRVPRMADDRSHARDCRSEGRCARKRKRRDTCV